MVVTTKFKQLVIRRDDESNWETFGKVIAEHEYDPYNLLLALWEKNREWAVRLYGVNVMEISGSTRETLQAQIASMQKWRARDLHRRQYMKRYFLRNPRPQDIETFTRSCSCGEFIDFDVYVGYAPRFRRQVCSYCGQWYRLDYSPERGYEVVRHETHFHQAQMAQIALASGTLRDRYLIPA